MKFKLEIVWHEGSARCGRSLFTYIPFFPPQQWMTVGLSLSLLSCYICTWGGMILDCSLMGLYPFFM